MEVEEGSVLSPSLTVLAENGNCSRSCDHAPICLFVILCLIFVFLFSHVSISVRVLVHRFYTAMGKFKPDANLK